MNKNLQNELKDFKASMLTEVYDIIAVQMKLLTLNMRTAIQSSIASFWTPFLNTNTFLIDLMPITQLDYDNYTRTPAPDNLHNCNTISPAKEQTTK